MHVLCADPLANHIAAITPSDSSHIRPLWTRQLAVEPLHLPFARYAHSKVSLDPKMVFETQPVSLDIP